MVASLRAGTVNSFNCIDIEVFWIHYSTYQRGPSGCSEIDFFSPSSGCYISYIKNSFYLTIATASISSIPYYIIFFTRQDKILPLILNSSLAYLLAAGFPVGHCECFKAGIANLLQSYLALLVWFIFMVLQYSLGDCGSSDFDFCRHQWQSSQLCGTRNYGMVTSDHLHLKAKHFCDDEGPSGQYVRKGSRVTVPISPPPPLSTTPSVGPHAISSQHLHIIF